MVAWAVSVPSAVEVLRVADRVPVTEAEGPGRRYATWLQGCSLRCAGCCNPELLDPEGGTGVPVWTLLDELRRAEVEGVSVLGGEPFDQATALAPFVQGAAALSLGVIVFSGFTIEELRARRDAATDAVLAATDLLIDGRYVAAAPEPARRFVGSANQRFHYLTGRYDPSIERASETAPDFTVEVEIRPGGICALHGWPETLGR
jgi:anaerobic ribonucleoside-triphosphate reductase activating protein